MLNFFSIENKINIIIIIPIVEMTVSTLLKEARNSFSFFQRNKHILPLHVDTVRVIISRRNLARVLSTQCRFLALYFPPK